MLTGTFLMMLFILQLIALVRLVRLLGEALLSHSWNSLSIL